MTDPRNRGQGTGNRQQATDLRKGSDVAERLLGLGVAVLRAMRKVPKDQASRHLAFQLIRSCTSGGANYEEARAAESRADFIHKVGVAAKEMRETSYWLKLIAASELTPVALDPIVREACELAAILNASARTARSNL